LFQTLGTALPLDPRKRLFLPVAIARGAQMQSNYNYIQQHHMQYCTADVVFCCGQTRCSTNDGFSSIALQLQSYRNLPFRSTISSFLPPPYLHSIPRSTQLMHMHHVTSKVLVRPPIQYSVVLHECLHALAHAHPVRTPHYAFPFSLHI